MTTGRDWHSFNKDWRDPIGERNFDRVVTAIVSIIDAPPKFWWGIFFGTLAGVILLAPESNFANRIRELFYTLQDSFAVAWEQSPWLVIFFLSIICTLSYKIYFNNPIIEIDKENYQYEIDLIKRQSFEERHFVLIENFKRASFHSGNLSILLVFVSLIFSWMLFQAE